jgi:hypothetical protein
MGTTPVLSWGTAHGGTGATPHERSRMAHGLLTYIDLEARKNSKLSPSRISHDPTKSGLDKTPLQQEDNVPSKSLDDLISAH